MANKTIYWAATGLSVLGLVLTVAYGLRLHSNRDMRGMIDQQQQKIVAGQNFEQVFSGISQVLFGFAVERDDRAIRDMLSEQGFQVPPAQTAKPASASPAPAAPAAPAKK